MTHSDESRKQKLKQGRKEEGKLFQDHREDSSSSSSKQRVLISASGSAADEEDCQITSPDVYSFPVLL